MRILLPLLGLLVASPASAKDMGGRFGVGADTTLGFADGDVTADGDRSFPGASGEVLKLPGLSVVYRATKIFGIQMIFSTQVGSGEQELGGTTIASTITQVGVGLRGHIAVGLGNAPRSEAVTKALESRRAHPSAMVREHVEWALGRQQGHVY